MGTGCYFEVLIMPAGMKTSFQTTEEAKAKGFIEALSLSLRLEMMISDCFGPSK